ncbi:nuclear transport factor 2 family protein [Actinomadura opuntiae]|uniref:nuclear transport factor 2 family protein n=1 Tax=Actinomadura sp. OS1-43 TaxID=604315 RepID=UPI00255AA443|nr:nuclear transport factor 2 family protein [Actinomadura sp. OS1-43]MDL4817358.1 nuclear transport factor 2 family protein [Actinomadura sp. OS1-43]
MNERIDVGAWVDRYRRAWATKDDEGIVDLFTPDAVYRSNPLAEPHVGRAAIAAYWRKATRTQQDLDLRFGAPVVEGDRATVEWWATMRDDDWYPAKDPSEGVTLPGCLVLTFAPDGRCAELREYYNAAFGPLKTAPDGWGL